MNKWSIEGEAVTITATQYLQSRWWTSKYISEGKSKEYIDHAVVYSSLGREGARTVFQWNSKDNASFCQDCKLWNGKEEPTKTLWITRHKKLFDYNYNSSNS